MIKRSILIVTMLIMLLSGLFTYPNNTKASNPCIDGGGDLSDYCMMSYLDYLGRYMAIRPMPHYGTYISPNGKVDVLVFFHCCGDVITVLPRVNGGNVAMYVSYVPNDPSYPHYGEYISDLRGTKWKKIIQNVVRADCKRYKRCDLVVHREN